MSPRAVTPIGVMADIRNTFHAEIGRRHRRGGRRLRVRSGARRGDAYPRRIGVVDTLLDFRCEALILLGPELADEPCRTRRQGAGGRRRPTRSYRRSTWCVRQTGAASADRRPPRRAGHRRISHLSGGSGTIPSDRKAGYVRAMKRHGLADEIDIIDGDFTEQAGILAARQFLGGGYARPRSVLPTTAARSVSSTSSVVPESRFPAVSRSPDMTTVCSPASPISI